MESRVKKQFTDECELDTSSSLTRSSRNAKLYQRIYDKYDDSDNLPIEDNTNEIDMDKLRELVLNNNNKEEKQIKDNLNILEQRKRQIDEQKVYDINKILEKAKYENNKLKTNTSTKPKNKKDLLCTLGSSELSLEEINKAKKQYQEMLNKNSKNIEQDEKLSQTRELKYKDLATNNTEDSNIKEEKSNTNSMTFDLFDDLKATTNIKTTKPIKNELSPSTIKSDIYSGDTSDIDIIKTDTKINAEEFFTNSYEFSKKDFADVEEDEDFFETEKKSGLLKIFLLFLAIIILVGVIVYFVGTYGLGMS